MKSAFKSVVAVMLLAAASHAADLAILRNGNSIRHDRRQVVGPITRLYLSDSSSGYIEIPTDQIDRFEVDTAPPAKSGSASQMETTPSHPAAIPATPAAQAAAVSSVELNDMVAGAGQRHQIDPDFINSVIRAESGFQSNAVSKKGAQGLMQLMPGTASELGVANPFDPKSNVEGGTRYLRGLLEKYNYDPVKALAAYNAGAMRVDQYHGVPPYEETRAYIARIIRDYNRKKIAENPALAKKTTTKAKAAASKRSNTQTKTRRASGPQKPPAAGKSVSSSALATSLMPQAAH
jgi:soluble lytic murein transglycosylase-like protein